MDNSSMAIRALVESMLSVAQQYIANASYDVTKQGRIRAILSNGLYSVEVQGALFTLPSPTDLSFSVGEAVWVTFPQNSNKDAFILGRRK